MAKEIQHSRAIPSNDAALTDIRIKAEMALTQGAHDKTHAFHLPALATVSGEGKPMVRHLILRAASPVDRTLHFFTDSRSQKIMEIDQNPDVNLVFYDPAAQVQLRVGGVATFPQNGQAEEAWRRLSPLGRRAYMAISGTGQPLEQASSALPTQLEGRIPEAEEVERGFANFTLICVTYDALDWLALDRAGNRRAQFSWQQTNKNWAGGWFVP